MASQPSRPLSAMVVLLALSVFAGCSLLPKAGPKELDYEGPGQPGLTVEPVGSPIGEIRTQVVALTEDGVVIAEPDGSLHQVGGDGEVRWEQPRRVELPGGVGTARLALTAPSVDPAAGAVVVAGYLRDPCITDRKTCNEQGGNITFEYGIVAFATDDGAPVWSKVLIPSKVLKPGQLPPNDFSWGVSVVSAAAVAAYVQHEDERDARTTFGFDPRTGERLWEVDGVQVDWAGGEGGGKLLGLEIRRGSGGDLDFDGYPVVLDARTGDQTWRSDDLGRWGPAGRPPVGDLDGYGFIRMGEELTDRPSYVVVDLATGATTSFDRSGVVGEDEAGPFYAWVGNRDGTARIVSTGLPSGEPAFGREATGQASPSASVGGYLWNYTARDRSLIAYDRTGARRSEPASGMLLAVNEDWLVTRQTDLEKVGIYRITR